MERRKHWPVSVFTGLSVGMCDAIGPFSKAAVKLLRASKYQQVPAGPARTTMGTSHVDQMPHFSKVSSELLVLIPRIQPPSFIPLFVAASAEEGLRKRTAPVSSVLVDAGRGQKSYRTLYGMSAFYVHPPSIRQLEYTWARGSNGKKSSSN